VHLRRISASDECIFNKYLWRDGFNIKAFYAVVTAPRAAVARDEERQEGTLLSRSQQSCCSERLLSDGLSL